MGCPIRSSEGSRVETVNRWGRATATCLKISWSCVRIPGFFLRPRNLLKKASYVLAKAVFRIGLNLRSEKQTKHVWCAELNFPHISWVSFKFHRPTQHLMQISRVFRLQDVSPIAVQGVAPILVFLYETCLCNRWICQSIILELSASDWLFL